MSFINHPLSLSHLSSFGAPRRRDPPKDALLLAGRGDDPIEGCARGHGPRLQTKKNHGPVKTLQILLTSLLTRQEVLRGVKMHLQFHALATPLAVLLVSSYILYIIMQLLQICITPTPLNRTVSRMCSGYLPCQPVLSSGY